ncbi:NADH-quinone oxidoreductase subunit L [bacterium]|nr:NADH-quinone oxidoreductase subunit L [bacterium]
MPVVETALLRWIVLCPLLGTILCLYAAKSGRDAIAKLAGPLSVLAAFAVTLAAVAQLWQLPPEGALLDRMYTWIHAAPLTLEAAFRLDHLSSVMILVITGVGFLIHVYSLGYMHDDPDVARFFAYMNLFTVSMLILVLGDSLPLLFIGWEGVGLCSYLLIGFWYLDEANADAGRKAFIANRIGDAAFLVGMFLLFWSLGQVDAPTLAFTDINHLAPKLAEWSPAVVTAICVLLFIGATGKSAQIPLYVWLPDAMAGPTPVSALIHAATMVTAGVYMIARLSPLYVLSPSTLELIAVIGAATAFFAATIGLVQRDLKKILAYSTVSQLGYMFLALGCGAFSAAIFHLMTHAFFKACLFLCAGSVMHALHGELDVFKMGGLKKAMPITARTFLVAALAISGFPGFSGFFSKDLILEAAYMSGHTWLWLTGVVAAGMTAFYVFRAYFLVFEGVSRVDEAARHHLHESPRTMTIPLIVLAVLSLVGGFIGLPHGLLWGDEIGHYLEPSVAALGHLPHPSTGTLVFLIAVASGVGLAGIGLDYLMYGQQSDLPDRIAARLRGLYTLLWNKYYVDELYDALVITPYVRLSRYFWQTVDARWVDGAVNGVGDLVRVLGGRARRIQTGNVQAYALAMLIGAMVVVAALVI